MLIDRTTTPLVSSVQGRPPYVRVVRILAAICVPLLLILGALVRGAAITHIPINSDGAVVGMMALQVLEGHNFALQWGVNYGGAGQYPVALVLFITGESWLAVPLTSALLTACSAVITWRIARRMVRDPILAALAGTLMWAVPFLAVIDTTFAYGYRTVCMLTGLGSVLVALRIVDGNHQLREFACLGLLAGVAWWSTPESVYYLFPAALLLGLFVVRQSVGWWSSLARLALTAAGAALGTLPWLWTNVNDGFASLHTNGAAVGEPGYLGRLSIFFVHVLPLELGLTSGSGSTVIAGIGGAIVEWVAMVAVALALVACLFSSARVRIIALAALAFPFFYAISPYSWYWQDGRFGMFLPPLLFLVGICAVNGQRHTEPSGAGARVVHRRLASNRQAFSVLALSTVVALALAWSMVSTARAQVPGAFTLSSWSDPDAATMVSVHRLEARHVTVGFANYWVAYRLDYLSNGVLSFSPVSFDDDRWKILYDKVNADPHHAWLFVPKSRLERAMGQFATANVEPGYDPETSFKGTLHYLDIRFTVVHAGLLDAIETDAPVQPAQVGIRPPS